ncbi:hypothetical protein EDD28_2441 [Salana multivorans]|uniref:Uncharacterized protein n=1 Tax=Salana multivorans TaxID=120377 RepID=A0A3N2D2P2_9MICO|nr:hypothetical protein [Salana multivorans]ROR94030.1 hypothetical protein EDD28_3460 [Salana multivorans]ROR97832.1 hypothetical protein EDD28_2441 [Salana multivorans]
MSPRKASVLDGADDVVEIRRALAGWEGSDLDGAALRLIADGAETYTAGALGVLVNRVLAVVADLRAEDGVR